MSKTLEKTKIEPKKKKRFHHRKTLLVRNAGTVAGIAVSATSTEQLAFAAHVGLEHKLKHT